MSFLRKRTNKVNVEFFSKFQREISKAPGFKPLLSYEDFLKIIDENKRMLEEKEDEQDS